MADHYDAITDQVQLDIVSAIGASMENVQFGRPKREIATYPNATVLSDIPTDLEGPRRRREKFTFEIIVRLPIPDPYPEKGGEIAARASYNTLSNTLAPKSNTAVPASPVGLYAGVGNPYAVTRFKYLESEDKDAWIGYRCWFEVETTIYQ